MVPHSIQFVEASLKSLPVAVTVSSGLILAAKSKIGDGTAKTNEAEIPMDVRATRLTNLLVNIEGYDHGGLNE